jgi:hypothetical protein
LEAALRLLVGQLRQVTVLIHLLVQLLPLAVVVRAVVLMVANQFKRGELLVAAVAAIS